MCYNKKCDMLILTCVCNNRPAGSRNRGEFFQTDSLRLIDRQRTVKKVKGWIKDDFFPQSNH